MSDRALTAAIEAARAAGEISLGYYRKGFDVDLKVDRSPVTQADREAERAIVEVLTRAFPEHGILGEEFGSRGSTETRWVIDPIDGTRNFVRRIPLWATLIALEEHGEITVGVIHVPTTGDLYTARRGGGAFLNGERLRVSEIDRLDQAFLVHGGLRLLKKTGHWERFMRLVDATDRQRGFGDYFGYTVLAEGKAEIYIEVDVKPWDLAPCKLVVEEAGGVFTDVDGHPTIYGGTALATNGRLHAATSAALRG